jgi:hypothetical protein
MALLLGAVAVSLTGCSTMQTTPQQDYVFAMGRICEDAQGNAEVRLDRVERDGSRYWMKTGIGMWEHDIPKFTACMQEQFKAHPYLDWFKARQASTSHPGGAAAVVPSPASNQVATTAVMAPVWHVGDEWQFAYKSPAASGTYVWAVDRIENLEGAAHYVIKAGTREIFYRVSDLASTLERVDGVVVSHNTPPRLSYAWPLAVGKTWEESHREERPADRQTLERSSLWTVETEETVTVPAGTFRTLKIVWRNKRTNGLLYEMWYAPDVKQWVKIRERLSSGVRERELVAYKLKAE